MMKKILIMGVLCSLFIGLDAVPNKLNQMVSPTQSTSQEFRTLPHTMPETISTDKSENPEAEEGNKPYNAACQFGLCLPGENNGRK